MQAAISEQTQSSSIGSDHASDVARPLGAEVKREDEPLVGEVMVRRLEDDSRV